MPRFVFNWVIVLFFLSPPVQCIFIWNGFMNPVTDILVVLVGDNLNFGKATILVQR